MMRLWSSLLLISLCVASMFSNAATKQHTVPAELTVIGYHEIVDPANALIPDYAVSPDNLQRQLKGLLERGYHFVSVDDILQANSGKKPLPEKAVLLTFDDGYQSFYQNAYPILKTYKAPAVLALVGSWLAPNNHQTVDFDGKHIARNQFFSWDELREMSASGLVEIGSHSYALHDGIQANPQGNMEPAVITRAYNPKTQKYETEAQYKLRIYNDLKKNNAFISAHGLPKPRVMIWPYGSYNGEAVDIAAQLGMPITLTLEDGPNTTKTPLSALRRILVDRRMTPEDLDNEISIREQNLSDNNRAQKIMHVDLDYIYDPDPAQQEKNLGHLLDRIVAMNVNSVYLQAFSDPDANGSADMVYFPNRHLPMRADLFNRVVWQIQTRTQVKRVYAWMPLLAWELPSNNKAAQHLVMTEKSDKSNGALNMGYHRLSPFSPDARQMIKDIYADLAKSAPIDGLLFHDDVTLSDYEDASPDALKQYQAWGLPRDLNVIRQDDALLSKWTALKTKTLDGFAMELASIVRRQQPYLLTARNLYAQPALSAYAENWYAQSLEDSLKHYDFTAIMAMPYMEQVKDVDKFYQDLVNRVKQFPDGLKKTVFELQATDWRNNQKIPSAEMAETISKLYSEGVRHVGYYPDDPFQDHPDTTILRKVFDTKSSAATP
jgi:biofilm PGA synthesis lipoprotein PgaB